MKMGLNLPMGELLLFLTTIRLITGDIMYNYKTG